MSQNQKSWLFILVLLAVSDIGYTQEDETTINSLMEDMSSESGDDLESEEVVESTEAIAADEDDTTTLPTDVMDNENDMMVEVFTILGSVRGNVVESAITNTTYYTFKGIPYAEPPINDLRFRPPVPVNAWGALDALEFGNMCPQFDFFGFTGQKGYIGDEDCLYLNIYTPYLPKQATENTSLRPVMVWIHGGSFELGSGSGYNPHELVTREDVVVVTINYRLGALGGVTLENEIAPGNLMLRDQIQALDWVNRYIRSFGGDPDSVTIFGESAGAVAVHALTLSPLATGFFSQAIAQSGTALFSYQTPAGDLRAASLRFAAKFGCQAGNTAEEVIDCLRQLEAKEIIMVTKETNTGETTDSLADIERSEEREEFNWEPVVDAYAAKPVLPLDPLTAMSIGAFNRVPLMLGTVKNEGAIMKGFIPTMGVNSTEVDWKRLATYIGISPFYSSKPTTADEVLLTQAMAKFYAGGLDFKFDQGWSDFMTDVLFLSRDQKSAELTSRHNPNVFSYQLTHASNVSFASTFGVDTPEFSPVHGDDISYLFEFGRDAGDRQPEDQVLAEKMMKYWANFAKYGHPSPLLSDSLPLWLPYRSNKSYMELKPEPELRQNLEPLRMFVWNKMFWEPRERLVERQQSLLQNLKYFSTKHD